MNFSFVLENCEDAVLARQSRIPAQKEGAVACLFRWIWNEPEIPAIVTLAAWWLSILFALNNRAPVGVAAGHLGRDDLALLRRAEAKALKGIAALYASLVAKQSVLLETHGGLTQAKASHAVWSTVMPDALAQATRDASVLSWPGRLRTLFEAPPAAAAAAVEGGSAGSATGNKSGGVGSGVGTGGGGQERSRAAAVDACAWLVGVMAFLVNGQKAEHVLVPAVERAQCGRWGRATDLAPALLHLQRSAASQPPQFPASARAQARQQLVSARMAGIAEEQRLASLPRAEREREAAAGGLHGKGGGPLVDSVGLPLRGTRAGGRRALRKAEEEGTNPPGGGGGGGGGNLKKEGEKESAAAKGVREAKEKAARLKKLSVASGLCEDDERFLHGRFVIGTSPLLALALSTRSSFGAEGASGGGGESEEGENGRGKGVGGAKRGGGNGDNGGTHSISVALTSAPAVHELDSFLLRFANCPLPSEDDDPHPGGGGGGGGGDARKQQEPSLFACLVAGGGAVRRLPPQAHGSGSHSSLALLAEEQQHARTPLPVLVPQRAGAVAGPALARVAGLKRQRRAARATAKAEDLQAAHDLRQFERKLDEKRDGLLKSELLKVNHVRKTSAEARCRSPGPVAMMQVSRTQDAHRKSGLLPRHHSVRTESFH